MPSAACCPHGRGVLTSPIRDLTHATVMTAALRHRLIAQFMESDMTDKPTDIAAAIKLLRAEGFTVMEPDPSEAVELFADVLAAWGGFEAYTRDLRDGDISEDARAAIEVLHAKLAAVRAERDA